MAQYKTVKIGSFLFERKGKFSPSAAEVVALKRIEKIDFSGRFFLANKASNTNMIQVMPGDFVISGINVAKGAMGIYEGKEPATATIHYSSYTFDKNVINLEYFKRFLKSETFIRLLQDQVKGGIKTEIKPKHLLPLEISLPNKEKQDRIVRHFESVEGNQFALSHEISHQQALLTKLRQRILQDAIEGKLTTGWRDHHPDTEPATELLKRIAAEKAQLIKAKKISKQKPLPPIAPTDHPFPLPPSWTWCRLNQVIYENPRNGFSPKEVPYKTSVKSLKLGATTSGTFDSSQVKFIDEQIPENSHLWLSPRDILIQRSNSQEHVGVSALYAGNHKKFVYPDLMMKIQPSLLISEIYLHHVLMSPYCRAYFRDNASGSQKSMPKINQQIVSHTYIPLPPLAEQQAIVARVEHLLSLCDQLDTQITTSHHHATALLQSILQEAFAGE